MPTLSQAKTLGGVGWILTLLLIVPFFIGTVLQIIGYVMIFMAVKYISELTGDRKIYANMVIGIAVAIVGTLLFAATVAAAISEFIGLGAFHWMLPGFGIAQPATPPADMFALFGTLAAGLLVVWVCAIVSSVYFRKSYDSISKHVGVGLFSTAALLYLIGAALAIILVGFILIFIAQILFIVAFFSLPDELPGKPTAQAPPPTST